MLLSANLSEALKQLIHAGDAPLDAIEVGPWFTVEAIYQARQELPEWPFHFHPSNLISRIGVIPGTLSLLRRYLACTDSPWCSMHITMLMPGMVWWVFEKGWRPPMQNLAFATRRLLWQTRKLQAALDIPVSLENVPALPFSGCEHEVVPERVAHIVHAAGSAFLLDIAHARIAADALQMDVYAYLGKLPLEQTLQIHMSGVRRKNGRLFDAHEPLEPLDYALLEWALARTSPQVVTLEYFKARDALREQLHRLHKVVQ